MLCPFLPLPPPCHPPPTPHPTLVPCAALWRRTVAVQVFEGIIEQATKASPSPTAATISALTTMERTAWATAREAYFSHGVNRASLTEIEAAVFVVALDPVRDVVVVTGGVCVCACLLVFQLWWLGP